MLIRHQNNPFVRYGVAVVGPILCIPIDIVLGLGILQDTPYLLLLLAVLTSAWYGGIGPGLVSTVAAAVIAIFYHFGPVGSMTIAPEYISRLAIFLAAGAFVSILGAARLTAVAELRARKEELEITLASIGDAVIATDVSGIITFTNPVADRLTGWNSREAVGRRLPQVFATVDERTHEPIPDFVGRTLEARSPIGPASNALLKTREGTEIPIDITAAPIRSGSRTLHGAVLVFHDITERRRQEEIRNELMNALEKERVRIDALVSSVPGVVWEAWGDPCDAGQRINFVSDYVETLLGYTRTEWLATPNFWLTIVHPEDRDRAAAVASETFASSGVGRNQYRWITRDGRTIWVESRSTAILDEAGRPVGMRGVTTDISDMKAAEFSLRRWEQLFRHAGWGVATSDAGSNLLHGVNPACASMHGYTVEELTGAPLAVLFAPEERSRIAGLIADINVRGQIIYESIHITRDGRRFPVLTDVIVVRDGDGRPLYRAANMQDISAQRQVEQELRSAKEAAEAANLAKDNFLAMLSHELRTPLTPVFTAAHLLAEAESLSEQDRELVTMITQSVEMEARLIDDLLELTRINQGKLHLSVDAVDIHDVITISLGFCQNELAGKEHTLTLAFDANESLIDGDAGRLQQVFWNLVKNAVKFTGTGGEIEIRTHNPSPGTIRIEVRDNGIGLEAEQLLRIFRPFEQAESTITRRFGGLGLGLAISNAIVRMHDGTISAHSDGPGMGATFAIDLPVRALADGRDTGEAGGEEMSFSDLRILVVASGESDSLAGMLDNQGYRIFAAASPGAALERATETAIDIAVIDLEGSSARGADLFAALSRIGPMRGIIIGESDRPEDLERIRRVGADELLAGSPTQAGLRETIRRVVALHR